MTYLNSRGYVILKSTLSQKDQESIKSDLTVKPKETPGYGINAEASFAIYLEGPTKLYVPKFYGLTKFGVPSENKIPAGEDIHLNFVGKLRPLQEIPVKAVLTACQDPKQMGALLCLSCGEGKCLGKDTQILMFNGKLKKVQDIVPGNQIMGDDSFERNVLSISKGREMMYKVILDNGDSFRANKSHILSVKKHGKDEIIDMSIREYLECSPFQMSELRAVKVPVEFHFFNGTKFFVNDLAYQFGRLLYHHNGIPDYYKSSPKPIRSKILSGILDFHGFYKKKANVFVINLSSKEQFDDVVFIARSLCYKLHTKKFSSSNYRCIIESTKGLLYNRLDEDFNRVEQLFRFKVVPLKEDEYFGFEIDGNRRFLLGDFTVTHNTVCAINLISTLAKKTLIVVHKEFLLQQWKERIHEFIDGDVRIGLIKASIIDVENKDIVIASLQSLAMKTYDPSLFKDFGTLVIDEIHHTSARVFSKALQKLNFTYNIGLTATPNRKDGLTKVFKWHIGDIAFQSKKNGTDDVLVRTLSFNGSNDPSYCQEHYLYNGKPNIARMINNICESIERTSFIVSQVKSILEKEPLRKVLILSERKAQLMALKEELQGYDTGLFFGGMKDKQLKESEEKQIILATMQMTSEGFDKKGLDTLILASPKSDIVQIVGRILRDKKEDRRHVPLIVDIIDNFSMFPNQASKRLAYYKKMQYVVE